MGKDSIGLLLTLFCSVGMICWGLSGLREIKSNKYKKRREKKLFGIFSKTSSDPIATLSYGQIAGGIMGMVFLIYWIMKYGIY